MKDLLVLESLGMSSIAPQSESSKPPMTLLNLIPNLLEKGIKIYILFDNDKAGKSAAENWKKIFKDIVIVELEDTKDISDYMEKHGPELTLTFLNNKINDKDI